jgi:hypothetical protein
LFSHHGRKGAFKLVGSTDHGDWLYFHSCRSARKEDFVEHGFREDRICGVAQHAHASC